MRAGWTKLGPVVALMLVSVAPGVAAGEALQPPVFSHEGGFYTQGFSLALSTTEPNATILYTLDGSEPTPDNTAGFAYFFKDSYAGRAGEPIGPFLTGRYETRIYSQPLPIADRTGHPERLARRSSTWDREPFYLPAGPVFQGTVVRARTIRDGAAPSPIVTHSYFVTPDGDARYSLPVLSLTIQEDDLFEYTNGIYTAGVDFDIWRNQNPGADATGESPANFQRRGGDAEMPMHMEVFLPGAGRAFAQALGIRIHGGNNTRAAPQKALRVYARNEYSTDAIEFPLIPGLAQRATGEPLETFRRVLLRNSGQDNDRTRLRDGFVHTLVAPLGLDFQGYAPAVHFINGEFWGLINIRERLDQFYLESHYGVDPNTVAIIENEKEIDNGAATDLEDLLALRAYAAAHDLGDAVHFDHMAARMDMDNFLLYNVIQIYTKNTDWPGNNRLAWRMPGAPAGGALHPLDGRWRWMIFDLDIAFGPDGSDDHQHNTLAYATSAVENGKNPPWSTIKLRRLLANEGFRTRFINLFADQMNTTFRPARVSALVDQLHARIAPHLPEHAARWTHTGDTSPLFLKTFGNLRPGFMRQHIVDYFELDGTAEVRVMLPPAEQARIRINSIELEPAGALWIGTYFRGVPIEIEVMPREGWNFLDWHGGIEDAAPIAQVTLDGTLNLAPRLQQNAPALEEVIVPRMMQGSAPDNNDRIPYVCRLRITGLLPNATYRYANRVVAANDPPTQNGAGNALYFQADTGRYFRTTATPDFADPATHGIFTTDASGMYEGWFVLEPTGNARFQERHLFIRILLNDGMGGDDYHHFLTTSSSVEVITFGTQPGNATGVWAASEFADRNIAILYADAEGQARPITAALVESTGATVDDRYAAFYTDLAAGRSGRFASLLPNQLPTGVVRIEERDRATGQALTVLAQVDGTWPDDATTVNPNGGSDAPIALNLVTPPNHDDPVPGDVDGDGVVNAVDVQLVINAALGIAIDGSFNADINNDGVVNAVDVQLVINAALGIPISPE